MKRVAVLLFLTIALSTPAGAALRDRLGEPKALAIEAALHAAVPGATLQWADTITVTMQDGAKSAVRIVGPEPFGTMWVMHVELADFAAAAMAHARTFSQEPAPDEPTDFLAAVDGNGSARISRLDSTAFGIEVKQFHVVEEYETPQTWPAVSVTYWAHYATADWVGSVRWSAAYNLQTHDNVARMPLGVAKKRSSGAAVAEQVVVTRATEEIVEIEGGQTGQIVQYPCPIPCTFDGKSLLAAWGATAATAAN
ncbi:MAG TPA: hypothetical protein VFP80_18035 [Thermoanaerobaculia bacterium]|nr:hypothetical protein [Thermoanaerobaculia bacterium]